ncbi:MAG: peptidoglycan-binding protein [Chroococcidiopsidaceae cyanobacterium CP_BM_RX_35]|nr:peptidoglycan-binding protein [Chroococcidiopsidaceae cyanobacterium CP_BM_RX_35]
MLLKPLILIFLTVDVFGISFLIPQSAIAIPTSPNAPMLLATAYTNRTLPTLRRGSQGEAVRKLQRILQDNGFLGAANARLGNPGRNTVDGIFGAVTESAIKDLQKRYNLPVTGVVKPATWEVLDTKENPHRLPLPWKG